MSVHGRPPNIVLFYSIPTTKELKQLQKMLREKTGVMN